eukprot:CFRG8246T1
MVFQTNIQTVSQNSARLNSWAPYEEDNGDANNAIAFSKLSTNGYRANDCVHITVPELDDTAFPDSERNDRRRLLQLLRLAADRSDGEDFVKLLAMNPFFVRSSSLNEQRHMLRLCSMLSGPDRLVASQTFYDILDIHVIEEGSLPFMQYLSACYFGGNGHELVIQYLKTFDGFYELPHTMQFESVTHRANSYKANPYIANLQAFCDNIPVGLFQGEMDHWYQRVKWDIFRIASSCNGTSDIFVKSVFADEWAQYSCNQNVPAGQL